MVIDSGRENLAYHVQVPSQEAEKPKTRQIPVTLLSGFLVSSGSIFQLIVQSAC